MPRLRIKWIHISEQRNEDGRHPQRRRPDENTHTGLIGSIDHLGHPRGCHIHKCRHILNVKELAGYQHVLHNVQHPLAHPFVLPQK